MYKILDLKRVFSTFQETVWSLLTTTQGYRFYNKEDSTIVMMGYKCLTHQMSLSPHEIATADELDALTF